MFMKTFRPQGVVCSCPGAIYMYLTFSETAQPMKAKFYVELPLGGGTKIHTNGLGHMTKMAAMPMYGKNLKDILQN